MKRVLYILLSVCLLTGSLSDAAAQTDKREVRRGNRRFNDGEYSAAQVEYMKALAKDSSSVAANYNIANSLFRQKDFDSAAKALERVEEIAAGIEDAASFYYNQGAVAIVQQNWQKAVDAFAKSLLVNPDDLDAKENYIYAKKMLQNQQQNQDQNQDQQQDQNQNQDQQQQDQNQDQQQDQNQDQQQQNQNQEQDQPQISPQAAQQMLHASQAKENETQEKVRKAKAAATRPRDKNW